MVLVVHRLGRGADVAPKQWVAERVAQRDETLFWLRVLDAKAAAADCTMHVFVVGTHAAEATAEDRAWFAGEIGPRLHSTRNVVRCIRCRAAGAGAAPLGQQVTRIARSANAYSRREGELRNELASVASRASAHFVPAVVRDIRARLRALWAERGPAVPARDFCAFLGDLLPMRRDYAALLDPLQRASDVVVLSPRGVAGADTDTDAALVADPEWLIALCESVLTAPAFDADPYRGDPTLVSWCALQRLLSDRAARRRLGMPNDSAASDTEVGTAVRALILCRMATPYGTTGDLCVPARARDARLPEAGAEVGTGPRVIFGCRLDCAGGGGGVILDALTTARSALTPPGDWISESAQLEMELLHPAAGLRVFCSIRPCFSAVDVVARGAAAEGSRALCSQVALAVAEALIAACASVTARALCPHCLETDPRCRGAADGVRLCAPIDPTKPLHACVRGPRMAISDVSACPRLAAPPGPASSVRAEPLSGIDPVVMAHLASLEPAARRAALDRWQHMADKLAQNRIEG